MSNTEQSLDNLSPEEQKKLKELMEKDAKSERKLTGPWAWLVAALAAIMVAIYFYGAGVAALSTQYHLGIYVLITFVLVFLLYPAGSRTAHGGMSLISATLLSLLVSCFVVYDSPTAFYQQLTLFQETWSYDGLGMAMEQDLDKLHYGLWLILPFAAILLPLDQWLNRRSHNSPTASDVILALMTAGTVLYWISQFEQLNYRAGAENEVDMLISIVGLLLSLEICRRVLGWSITLIGVAMIAFALFGPYLPELLAHRGFRFERLATALFLTTNGV
ncbi:MAG: TRAP transporter permease, partial [Oceanisphaera sp.]|nr:TRAP transporter permease [Oceanisphaera sp.]